MKTKTALLISAAACLACVMAPAGQAHAADSAGGEKAYKAKCASCHGADGSGNPGMEKVMKVKSGGLNLTGDSQKRSNDELSSITSKGGGKMPAYGEKLKPEEIKEIVVYVRTLASAKGGGKAEETGKPKGGPAPEAAPLFKKNCTTCHGADAKGNPAMAKMFKVEPDAMSLVNEGAMTKTDAELADILAAGKGRMPAFKAKLTEDEIKALIKFLRTLAGAKKEPAK